MLCYGSEKGEKDLFFFGHNPMISRGCHACERGRYASGVKVSTTGRAGGCMYVRIGAMRILQADVFPMDEYLLFATWSKT